MAVAKSPPLGLTRDQLATFLKTHEAIKQFENLFRIVEEFSSSGDTSAASAQASAADALSQIVDLKQDSMLSASSAHALASAALAQLSVIADALQLIATSPAIENNNSVVTDYIDFPAGVGTAPSIPSTPKERRLYWNPDDGTLDVGIYGNETLQVGQELVYYAKNTSGGSIAKGTPVMFDGSLGASGKLKFKKAIADGSVPSDYMMGVATNATSSNDFGYVTSFGLVRGFDTTGTPYGEVWADGDLLYFDPVTPGAWTKTQPSAPNIDVPVAVVVHASAGSGSIFVRMKIAESLNNLQDVHINGGGPTEFDVLLYNNANSRWENYPASAVQVLAWVET